jgi:hypothetical protein
MTELDQLHRALVNEREQRRQGTWRQDSPTTEASMREIADHEAAHVVAAVARRGIPYSVEVYPWASKKADRLGPGATATEAMKLSADDALISLVGYAWEEALGQTSRAWNDLTLGHHHAAEADSCSAQRGAPLDDHLSIARRFVKDHHDLIRETGAKILAAMPKREPLEGRRLDKILAWVREQIFGPAATVAKVKKKRIVPSVKITARDFYARRKY